MLCELTTVLQAFAVGKGVEHGGNEQICYNTIGLLHPHWCLKSLCLVALRSLVSDSVAQHESK